MPTLNLYQSQFKSLKRELKQLAAETVAGLNQYEQDIVAQPFICLRCQKSLSKVEHQCAEGETEWDRIQARARG